MSEEEYLIPPEMIDPPAGYPADLPLNEVDRRFRALLGPFETPSVPLNVRMTQEEVFGDIVRQKVEYEVEPGETVRAYHLFRKDIAADAPGVLAIHLHGGNDCFPLGKDLCSQPDASDPRNYAYIAALRGFRVLAPDALCFGERVSKFGWSKGHWDEIVQHTRLCSLGHSLAWKSVWDNSRALEVLEQFGASRLGVMGHSGGSTQSYILASVNRKVQAAACFASFLTLRHQYYQYKLTHCFYHFIPGMMAAGLDWDQVAALIAPRSIMMIYGDQDVGTPEPIVQAFKKRIDEADPHAAEVYCDRGCDHYFTMDALNAALDFLGRKLSL